MTQTPTNSLRDLTAEFLKTEEKIRLGGGKGAIDRQHEKGRLTARERVGKLVDAETFFQELGLWCAHGMYQEHGGAPSAGVVTGIGVVRGRRCMIIANDATVKAGAFFPMTCKKIIRAQTIAMMARLPLIYLVDSAGVFLPMQEDVFPDTDDFGRIFRNNAVISAMGIPQIAAIMGYCVAGGGYLPVLCDTLLMTEGSGLYLAGPALVKAAIGQEVSDEELGGAEMHASVSGTIDFREKDDEACVERLRSLVEKYRIPRGGAVPEALGREMTMKLDQLRKAFSGPDNIIDKAMSMAASMSPEVEIPEVALSAADDPYAPIRTADELWSLFSDKAGTQYDAKQIVECLVDRRLPKDELDENEPVVSSFDEYKTDYGQSLVCGYAMIGGRACGIVANQKKLVTRTMPGGKSGPTKAVQMPGVIYDDSADKAARFIMDCNQRKIPIVFLHDTTGFMVGRDSEQGGIIRAGAKMVNAMSNCVVPKIVVILGGSYGAGNYAMCGRAFDQFMSFAWPSAKCAVMGANQATGTLAMIEEKGRERRGEKIDEVTHKAIMDAVRASYSEQQDIRHGAARGWVDRIIEPHRTREELIAALEAANQGWDYSREFKTGVLQT
ncbi:3-methylcrotonyl-CoA carboxylase beta subunit [Phycisphaerales bacterium]|nr:3-methylcrotonyl-CoA carboxylase beta subunit [Phycisphaerales bacterium]